VLVCGFALRLQGIRHGLPFVYHSDEVFHFTSRAVAMFSDGLNPNYFQNPSAFTYLVHLALRFQYGGGWPLGDFGHLVRQFADDPSEVYATARQLATVLSMLGVVAVYAVGRRLWGAMEGLAAAAVLAFAFLPVAYSRLAVTDVGVLAPVALVMLAAVRAHEDGRDRWYLLGGAAAGLAIGFKYTAGLVLAPLLLAAVLRAPRGAAAAIRATAVALAAAAAVFVVTTPYFIPDLDEAIAQLRSQSYAADEPKLGQEPVNGHLFYLRSLTWGLGWGAALAAAAGAVLELRRDRRRLALLALFPILLLAYLGTAERFFGRWLMPAYPVLALLAAVALARAARALSARPAWRGAALVALLAAVLAQPVAAGLRTGRLLQRQDTRTQARDFLLRTLPTGTRIVVEPAVPRRWYRGLAPGFGPPPPAKRKMPPPPAAPTRFIDELSPQRLDRYRRDGFCYVVTMSMVRGRAEVAGRRDALAYYRALERQSTVVFRADPYRRGSSPVPFDFDFSTHLYYPSAYDRPGPDVAVFRLDRCRPQTAPVRR
jgi:hypothetical protein